MQKIPIALIYSRLFLGILIVILSLKHIENYNLIAVVLLTIGLLTDIFDGIIARKLNISTQTLRRLDSSVDQVFFIGFAIATYIQCPDFFKNHAMKLGVLIGIECLTYVVSYIKFRKEIATHSLGAKFWTLILFATLIQIILTCKSSVLFEVCFWIGIITRLEIISIILTLKSWTNDVPSIYHALQLRKGKEIKRNKMFNG
jgi:phosphatidylglycerophosphate synthase